MIFETHTLKPRHAGLIESIFHYKNFRPDHIIERVVPTGHSFVIFEFDDFERNTFDNDTLEANSSFRKAWISGPHLDYLSISAHSDSEMFVIQFKAHGGLPFLHLPMNTFVNRVISGNEILNGELLPLRKELLAAESSADKFTVVDAWLDSKYDSKLTPPDSIVEVVNKLQIEPAAKFSDIIDSFDGTQKHLIDLFKKYVGLTPKQFQRISRFNDVLVHMQGDLRLSWSDIAYQCGFSDQSHFIREFKKFSGFNPKTFIERAYDAEASNFFPLDRDG